MQRQKWLVHSSAALLAVMIAGATYWLLHVVVFPAWNEQARELSGSLMLEQRANLCTQRVPAQAGQRTAE